MNANELSTEFNHKRRKVSDLVTFLKNSTAATPNYSFFLGAGSSATSGIATAKTLVSTWRREAYQDVNPNPDSNAKDADIIKWLSENARTWYSAKAEYSSLFEKKFSLPKQRMDFIEKEVSGRIPSIGYPYLVKLAEKNFCNVVFTTNFDDLLNESFYQFSSERPIVCAHDSSVSGISLATRRPKVIKLHGDFLYEAPKSSQEETNRLSKNMDSKLREFAKIYGLIMVGYSGGDKSIMRILDDLVDDSQYLQNGLFWCFREGDEINEEVLSLLKKNGVFFVIIEGFDELMAELYGSLCDDGLPFEPRPGSDFAAKIIKSYEESNILRESKCEVIRNHMVQLAEAKNSSAVAEALQSLHSERSSETKLKDDEFLKYIQLSKLFRVRNYQAAFDKIREMIDECDDREFKTILLSRLYFAAKGLYQYNEAKRAVSAWRDLEPDNALLCLLLADVTDDQSERIKIISDGLFEAPFNKDIALRYAEELESSFDILEGESRPAAQEIVAAYKRAIELKPIIGNDAWRGLFDFLQVPATSTENQKLDLKWIINEHIKQDSYDYRTVEFVLDWCERYSVDSYEGVNISEFITNAYRRHYPKKYPTYLRVLKNAFLKHNQYASLKELVIECEKDSRTSQGAGYILVKMDLLYSVYRDLDQAILIGEDFIRGDYSVSIERMLFGLYLNRGDLGNAQKVYKRLRGAIDINDLQELEAQLCEHTEDYQGAIDLLEAIAKRKGKNDEYFASVSFLLLKMGRYDEARKICNEFLTPRNFGSRYDVIIINYEYAKIKSGKSASKQRLHGLLNSSVGCEPKAVAKLLLGNSRDHPNFVSEAKSALIKEIEIDFKCIDRYLRWPVLESLDLNFKDLRESLIENRRKFPKDAESLVEPGYVVDV